MNALKLPYWTLFPMDMMTTMDVQRMTLAEEGGYIRLLNYDWLNDGLRDDDNYLAELSRLDDAWFNGAAQKIRPLFAPVRTRSHPTLIHHQYHPATTEGRIRQICVPKTGSRKNLRF